MSSQNELFSVTSTIVRRVIAQPDVLPYFTAQGLDYEDWPEDWDQRKMLETFQALVDDRGAGYAQHILAMDALKLEDSAGLPRDPEGLFAVYHLALGKHRRRKLQIDLANAKSEESFEAALSEYSSGHTRGIEVFNFADRVRTILERNEQSVRDGTAVVRIPDWAELSDMIGGFNPGRLGILAAASGFGKTSLALNLARSASKAFPVLFVNMEMNEQDIGERIYIGATETDMKTFKAGRLNMNRTETLIKTREGEDLYYTDGTTLSLPEIYGVIRRVSKKSKKKIKLVVVDYDQKIALKLSRDNPQWMAVQKAVEDLEQMAKKEDLYILLLAQANEDGDPGASKRSKFPASSLLYFHKDDRDRVVIEALKNRFGVHGATIEVYYRPHMSHASEAKRVQPQAFGPIP